MVSDIFCTILSGMSPLRPCFHGILARTMLVNGEFVPVNHLPPVHVLPFACRTVLVLGYQLFAAPSGLMVFK